MAMNVANAGLAMHRRPAEAYLESGLSCASGAYAGRLCDAKQHNEYVCTNGSAVGGSPTMTATSTDCRYLRVPSVAALGLLIATFKKIDL
jgi:hypothetical protein